MTVAADAPALMRQAARLYYDRGLSKVEIAAALGVSRFRVARLLSQAREDGLVRIEYRDLPRDDRDLASAVEAAFGLDLCVVAAGTVADIAGLAAEFADQVVGPGDVVGIGWGSTLSAVVDAMPDRKRSGVEVVQLAGNASGFTRAHDPAEITRRLAERWGVAYHPLFAPAFVDLPDARAAILRQADVAATIDRYATLTIAIVGVGALPTGRSVGIGGASSSLARSGALSPERVRALTRVGAVGDVLLHPVTIDGLFPDQDLAARVVGIGIDRLRNVRRVIAVAGGSGKIDAIRGALRSGVLDVLVTDGAAARGLVAKADR